jgi:hypothetical protein
MKKATIGRKGNNNRIAKSDMRMSIIRVISLVLLLTPLTAPCPQKNGDNAGAAVVHK